MLPNKVFALGKVAVVLPVINAGKQNLPILAS